MTTNITVQVQAAGGKLVGDDIGGALVTVRDADTREFLTSGKTTGTSTAASFPAVLNLSAPRKVEITALGPLGSRESANTASVTTWVYPGLNIPPTPGSPGVLLTLPGLICEIVNPVTHSVAYKAQSDVNFVVNIAMMCGCPINDTSTWSYTDFVVQAFVTSPVLPAQASINMVFNWQDVTGQFGASLSSFVNLSEIVAGPYLLTVVVQQQSTGNTGMAQSTFIMQ